VEIGYIIVRFVEVAVLYYITSEVVQISGKVSLHFLLFLFLYIWYAGNVSDLVVSMLATGTQDRGFKPAKAVWFFGRNDPHHAFFQKGSKAVSVMLQLCGMWKPLQFSWKSHFRLNYVCHFSPIIPLFTDRGLSRHLTWSASGDDGNLNAMHKGAVL
jgi:hypothetical protein